MKPISTRTHGVLDYMAVVLLLALPRILGWSERVTTLLTVVAVGMLLASLLTRYELGAFKLLPMKAHLALDLVVGVIFIMVAMALDNEPNSVRAVLGLLGLFEIGNVLMTQTVSPVEQQAVSG
jgi:hypothetical protein